MTAWSNAIRSESRSIGLVPTMGFFHEGHLSLMRASKQENNKTVVSLFVNPMQFGPHEDLENYPRDFERDAKIAESAGVDILFYPEADAIYPPGFLTSVEVDPVNPVKSDGPVGQLGQVLCGKSRPTHFRGVATVVSKLFNIVKPHCAYFGQKDYQQSVIIRKMVSDLNFDVHVKVIPTHREADGLAMSSRNTYLSTDERMQAASLYRGLSAADSAHKAGERRAAPLRLKVEQSLNSASSAKIDYIEIVHPETLQAVDPVGPDGAVIAAAVHFGKTRLIDNIILKEPA